MQLFYNLSDPAMEYSLYEIESMRRFAGLRLSGALPDESTIPGLNWFAEKLIFMSDERRQMSCKVAANSSAP